VLLCQRKHKTRPAERQKCHLQRFIVDICWDTVVKYLTDNVHWLSVLAEKCPIIDMALDILTSFYETQVYGQLVDMPGHWHAILPTRKVNSYFIRSNASTALARLTRFEIRLLDFIRNESAPIQLAQCRFLGLTISSGKILIYCSNKTYQSNFIKQHSETVMVWNYQNADCSL